MQTFMARLGWYTAIGVAVLALAAIGGTVAVSMASNETLSLSALSALWLNFGLALLFLGGAIFLAARFLKSDRKSHSDQARTEHLADVALLASGLAHEVRNHLHALQSRIGLLRKNLTGNDTALERVARLDEIADGMEQLVNNFLTLARPAIDEPEQLDPAQLIREVVEFERLDLDRLGVAVELDLQDDLLLYVDRAKLKRALLNIVVNARQAMPSGGRLRISCRRKENLVRIVVKDNGEGIPQETLPRIFESYFTTKSEGSGLGLAIVRRTVEDFGGQVYCESTPATGTTMTIDLPLHRERSKHRSKTTGGRRSLTEVVQP